MINLVEAFGHVCFQNVFGLLLDGQKDRPDSIATRAAWSEAERVRLSLSLTLSASSACLTSACKARSYMTGMESGPLFRASRFRYPNPSARGRFVSKLKTSYQRQSGFRRKRGYTINACRFLSLIVLSDAATAKHLADQDFIISRWSLRTVLTSPTQRGSIDAILQLKNSPS